MSVDQKALFDYKALESEFERAAVAELAALFLEETADCLTLLKRELEAKNTEGIRSLAHKMRGGCRSISSSSVEKTCRRLERACMPPDFADPSTDFADWPHIEDLVSTLSLQCKSLFTIIQEYLNTK
jgi:HPt (histidine-containing phosphotransfer) domain-containing protein